MSKLDIQTTIQLAQGLVDHLPEEMNNQLKEILLHAGEKRDPTIGYKITNLLTSKENTRRWLKEQTNLQSGTREGYSSPPGKAKMPPSSQRWVCPVHPNDHWLLVMQEGEEPPVCEKDKKKMVRTIPRKG
jgi:hypothetical protein